MPGQLCVANDAGEQRHNRASDPERFHATATEQRQIERSLRRAYDNALETAETLGGPNFQIRIHRQNAKDTP